MAASIFDLEKVASRPKREATLESNRRVFEVSLQALLPAFLEYKQLHQLLLRSWNILFTVGNSSTRMKPEFELEFVLSP